MDEICAILKEYLESDTDNIIDLFKEYSASTKDKTEVHSRLKKIKCTKLMAFDANGLYASAMSDLDSEYPRAESGRPFLPEENKEFAKLFNEQKFRPRTAILKVWFEYPKNMFFQQIQLKIKSLSRIKKINEEEKEFIPPKSTRLVIWDHSFYLTIKKIMNNFIRVIDGFYKPEIYYTNTDSLYISSSNWDKLNEAGLVSENDYCKGKNDYGDGGIIFDLYLAPKVQYNIILTSDGVLKEKKTFKGYSKDQIFVEDNIRLASGLDVTNEFKKPWVKSFTDGIVIPNDKQKKVFRSYLNLVKSKAPNSEGIMYPYNDGKELNRDENYEFDDYDYLTIQEGNEDSVLNEVE
ncbi:hypothetical protein LOTGIDRAFT_155190 [Lottia gigantea]|uniref:DNA-directed DNA polymerase n=1 Tax=Lottia gigantea TaxID=225164 RepID=V4B9Q1_LOTGI|nr:hypothetical protein LOTGIDRAFT_155190 [Lottia gigantea]ESO85699.1 hypothetical protein LOTGIDRAFT_155190 [Lottia gigantea]